MLKNKYLNYFLALFIIVGFFPIAFLGPTTQDDNTWLLIFNEVMASDHPIRNYFDYTINYAKMQGRLGFFISFPLISFPYLFKSIFFVGLIKVVFLVGMVYSLFSTVRYFSGEVKAALSVIFFTGFHTLTWFHSGFVSYSIQFYFLVSLFLISLQIFSKYQVTGRIQYAFIAAIFYLLCLSIEIFYVFFPAYILVILLQNPDLRPLSLLSCRRSRFSLGLLMLISVIYFIGYLWFRSIYASMYLGNQIASDFDVIRFLRTDLKMAIASVPGVVPFYDSNYLIGNLSLFSAKGIIYCLSSFFVFPFLIFIRSNLKSFNSNDERNAKNLLLRSKSNKFLCCCIVGYLFFASVSLPSLTSLYQAMLLDYDLWGYIYTFIAFIILSIFAPVIFIKILSANKFYFIFFAVIFSLLALISRGYSQKSYEEMSAATQRWEHFDSFLKAAPDLQNFGCIRSQSLFKSDHLVSVLDDYWTRFAKSRLGDKFNQTQFIREVGGGSSCGAYPGRFEFIFDANNQIIGWYLYPSIDKQGSRILYVYSNQQGGLYIEGGVFSDHDGSVYVPAKGGSIQIPSTLNRVVSYQIYANDVSILASGLFNASLVRETTGMYPAEFLSDGSIFWWAHGSSTFKLSLDRSLLPDDVSLKFYITPVGARSGDKFSVECNGTPISIIKIGSNPEQPFQVVISSKNLIECTEFSLLPSWPSVHLSPSDARVFSFQLAQFKYYKGVEK